MTKIRKFSTITAATIGAAAVMVLQRARRSPAAQRMHDLASPANVNDHVDPLMDGPGDGHAVGHRHLSPSPEQTTALLAHRARRAWTNVRSRDHR